MAFKRLFPLHFVCVCDGQHDARDVSRGGVFGVINFIDPRPARPHLCVNLNGDSQ